jgi:hypothetical protein
VDITDYQLDLMRHTVSDPGRNWFGTSRDCKDGQEFEKLVAAGYATSESPPSWMGDDVIYRLTDKGLTAVSP